MLKDKSKGVGIFRVRHFRNGKLLSDTKHENLTTLVGRNYLLNAGFHGSTPVTTWSCGLIDNASFSAVDETDTAASHAGWVEFTGYSESVRQEWTEDAATGGAITNSTEMTFTVSANGTVQGLFLSSSDVKSGTTGTLWNAVELATGSRAVLIGDILKVTYQYGISA